VVAVVAALTARRMQKRRSVLVSIDFQYLSN